MSGVNGNSLNGLPKGWQWVKLESLVENPKQDIVDGPFGSNLKSHEYVDEGVPVFKIQNIKANRFVDKNLSCITKEKAKALSRHSFKAGDLIITKLGDPLGLCCKVPEKYPEGIIVADLMRLRPSKRKVYDKFLINVINSDVVQSQFKIITKGTTRPRVNLTIVRDIKIPLPSFDVQQRIVSKIEELFSELDKNIEQLKTAQQQLKVYRQSVLKWAFEGRLTNKEVKEGEMPEGWKWVTLRDHIEKIEAGKSFKCDERTPKHDEVGVLKVSAVTWGEFDEDESKTVIDDSKVNPNYYVQPGDFLFSRANTMELVGASVIIKHLRKKLMLSDKTLRINFTDSVSKYYVLYYLRSRKGRYEIERLSTGNQESMRNIGQDRIKQIQMPLCLLEEQNRAVQEIESRLSVADKVEETILNSLEQAEALRQSILKKAFEGGLT